jgi:hypothetical protein
MELVGQPTIPASQELSLEDTLKAFKQIVNQPCQEITNATVANTEAIARLEGQFSHLVAEFNRIEPEELQSQEMAKGQYMIDEDCPSNSYHQHVQATTLVSEEKVVNTEEEKEEQVEQFEPLPISSNDKEVSIKTHSLVTIPLETYHSPQVSSFQCIDEPSYVAIFEDSCTQDHKSRNRGPKRNFRSKLLGYKRWWNILPEGYLIFKKKGWKGLVGHPYERGRCVIFSFFISYTLFFSHFIACSFCLLFV